MGDDLDLPAFVADRVPTERPALLVLACFVGAPLAARALGHGPNEYFPQAANCR